MASKLSTSMKVRAAAILLIEACPLHGFEAMARHIPGPIRHRQT
jgi:hypothetical protein